MPPSASAPSRPSSAARRTALRVGGAALLALLTASGLAMVLFGGNGSEEDAIELEHIHGLGVDPSNGSLYAGTHYGLFRIPNQGTPDRVANVQDFMGFTVAGPGRFLASGHPGEGQTGPNPVGLIESTDGGRTWAPRSLAGEVDFHALEYRHGTAYGVSASTNQLLVSTDLKNWRPRRTEQVADIAVSPTEPGVLLATTGEGLKRSTDGGRTFSVVAEAPVSLLVSWAPDGTVVVATPDGTIHTSSGRLTDWTERGALGGAPEALSAQSATEVYAAANASILTSSDGGATFTVRYAG